jgi:hypothetical protein
VRFRKAILSYLQKGLHMIATLLFATALYAAPAQTPKTETAKVEPLTLTGCVSAKPGQTGEYEFTNEAPNGTKYRLTGKNVKKYAGQKVELVQSPSKNLVVKGGLYPSPNVAGQAGALDPTQAAIATQPGGGARAGTGTDLPEFRVERVRAVPGACQ